MATMRLCSWLLMAVLLSLSVLAVSEARGLPRSAMKRSASSSGSKGKIAFNVEAWLQLMREKISQLKRAVEESNAKRGCYGFPCMHTHLGAQAAKQAYFNTILSKLRECVLNPKCNPGKRRRRSASAQAVLSMLTRGEKTTS